MTAAQTETDMIVPQSQALGLIHHRAITQRLVVRARIHPGPLTRVMIRRQAGLA